MIDRNFDDPIYGPTPARRRHAVDGLIIDDRWVWVVLGGDEVDTVGMLLGGASDEVDGGDFPGSDMVICRRVEGDSVVIGRPDPKHDRLLSQWLEEDAADHV